MTLYQSLLRNHPELRDKLVELYQDELSTHKRQGRRYSLDHFGEELGDELMAALLERNIPDSTEEPRKVVRR